MMEDKKVYSMTIKPAIAPKKRHEIEDSLKLLGYKIRSGGTYADMSECDISFEEET